MPTDKEISDLEQIIQNKLGLNRLERSTLNQANDAITSIKMLSRQVEETAAVATILGKPAVMDGETIVTPATPEIPGKPAIMKTVFDVSPKDPLIPTSEMDDARRQAIFTATKTTIDSL